MIIGTNSQPPFMLYVVWHPNYALGEKVAGLLHDHYGAHRYRNVAGGASARVIFRNAAAPGSQTPLPIDWDSTGTTAVVALIDHSLTNDPAWVQYVHDLAGEAADRGLNTRVFPVEMEAGALEIGLEEQALRWDQWAGTNEEREQRLLRDLTHEFNRMLRHHLVRLQHPDAKESLERYLKKVNVFLSHSKHDDYGERIAGEIRDWLHNNSALSSFLDIYDIPVGTPFSSVIDHSIQDGVIIVIYTDSYSSREWCRREVITAKRANTPMLVVDCLQTVDERAFPYLGNVPFIRMDTICMDRIDQVVGLLLDEVFKDFLWRCSVERLRKRYPQILFIARSPELMSLVNLPARADETDRYIVYPDPPLGQAEAQLFADIAHDVHVQSLRQWLAEE